MFVCLCAGASCVMFLRSEREMSRGVGMKVYVYLDGQSPGKEEFLDLV